MLRHRRRKRTNTPKKTARQWSKYFFGCHHSPNIDYDGFRDVDRFDLMGAEEFCERLWKCSHRGSFHDMLQCNDEAKELFKRHYTSSF